MAGCRCEVGRCQGLGSSDGRTHRRIAPIWARRVRPTKSSCPGTRIASSWQYPLLKPGFCCTDRNGRLLDNRNLSWRKGRISPGAPRGEARGRGRCGRVYLESGGRATRTYPAGAFASRQLRRLESRTVTSWLRPMIRRDQNMGPELTVSTTPDHTDQPVQSLTWLPDNATLVVADQNGSTSFWNAKNGQQINVQPAATQAKSLNSPDQRLVAELIESDQPPRIQVLDATSGAVHSVWQAAADDQIRTFAWSFDGSKLAIRKNLVGRRVWSFGMWITSNESPNGTTAEESDLIGNSSQNAIAWSFDGSHLAVAAMGETTDNGTPAHQGHVYVVDVAQGKTTLKHNLGGGSSPVWPGGRTAGHLSLGTAMVLSGPLMPTRDTYASAPLLHNARVNSLAWSPCGRRIVSSGDDGLVKILSATGGEDLLSFALQQGVTSVAWSPDGRRLAAGAENGEIQIWDASRGYEFSEQGRRRGELAWAYYRAASSDTRDVGPRPIARGAEAGSRHARFLESSRPCERSTR